MMQEDEVRGQEGLRGRQPRKEKQGRVLQAAGRRLGKGAGERGYTRVEESKANPVWVGRRGERTWGRGGGGVGVLGADSEPCGQHLHRGQWGGR